MGIHISGGGGAVSDSVESLFIGAASFERRCTLGPIRFLEDGGGLDRIRMGLFAEDSVELGGNIDTFKKSGILLGKRINRFSSRSVWDWVWSVAREAYGNVIVDSSCLPREPLAMLLFALSLRREFLESVRIDYVSVNSSSCGYATQNQDLDPSQQWLSRGVSCIRSIVGYPGDFRSGRTRHIVAFAGHEFDRLHETIVFYEPDRLSISSEASKTSIVPGAVDYSNQVAERLRTEIALPEIREVSFCADSIEKTFRGLSELSIDTNNENVALVPMNTKLSFIGACLFALHHRDLRMVYAVPDQYNPLYSSGIGDCHRFDITGILKKAGTPEVLPRER